MRTEHKAQNKATATSACRLICALTLVLACIACNRFGHYTLVSQEYGFSVTFPEKPEAQSDKNYQGLPKRLWTLYRNNYQEFYSAQATSYKDVLPTEGWFPGKEVGESCRNRIDGRQAFQIAFRGDRAGSSRHCYNLASICRSNNFQLKSHSVRRKRQRLRPNHCIASSPAANSSAQPRLLRASELGDTTLRFFNK